MRLGGIVLGRLGCRSDCLGRQPWQGLTFGTAVIISSTCAYKKRSRPRRVYGGSRRQATQLGGRPTAARPRQAGGEAGRCVAIARIGASSTPPTRHCADATGSPAVAARGGCLPLSRRRTQRSAAPGMPWGSVESSASMARRRLLPPTMAPTARSLTARRASAAALYTGPEAAVPRCKAGLRPRWGDAFRPPCCRSSPIPLRR